MPKTSGEIVVNADPALIMDVICELEKYPEWADGTAGVDVIEGTATRPIIADLKIAAGPIKDTIRLKYEYDGVEKVTWHLTQGSVLTKQDGSYILEDNGDGSVKLTYEIEIDTKIKLPGFAIKQAQKQIVKTGLSGVKKRAESLSQ